MAFQPLFIRGWKQLSAYSYTMDWGSIPTPPRAKRDKRHHAFLFAL